MQGLEVVNANTAAMRGAGRGLLSLALMDSRNASLRWAATFEAGAAGADPVARALGRLGWFQEAWIARNVQRQRGERCDGERPKLASILPQADTWFERPVPVASRGPWREPPLPGLQTIRQYLADTLEQTLELLEGAADDDAALYFYRLALLREDATSERFAVLAQTLGVDAAWLAPSPTRPARPPLWFPATRASIGSAAGGFVPDAEQWAHVVALPEFEIDAQAVSWAQFAEFVEDGGYDDRRHWHDEGWAWLQAEPRRTPRHVEQMRHGVLQRRFGRVQRVPGAQPAVHVGWYEAEAWCRWAGRRLPHETEWEAAAVRGASRGFRWGEVHEWTAGTLRPYPGAPSAPSPGQGDLPAAGPGARVQRGASGATCGRLRAATARSVHLPTDDAGFSGFRSCSV